MSRPSKKLLPALERVGGNLNFSGAPEENLTFSGVAYDSRRVAPGDAFFCIEGERSDGNRFIADAVKAGAACIVTERELEPISIPVVKVTDVRNALADFSDYVYDSPSASIRLIGVTGTNGKTTVTHIVEYILRHAGKKVGLIGTLGARTSVGQEAARYLDTKHTTPQASDLQKLLREMADSGVTHVAMEVSSHALALKRTAKTEFSVVCLTNITQDHLDFHKTMEHYWRSKRILFEQLCTSSQFRKTAVINADDPLAEEFRHCLSKDIRVWTYGFGETADARVLDVSFNFKGTRLKLSTPMGDLDLNMRLNGRFNVYNTMAALLIGLAEGVDLETCKLALESFAGVPGRFQTVGSDEREREPLCIVDYAHTPDGLENVLKAARALVPQNGRLIVVFGCGGDRDATKRPQMGGIAEKLADRLYVTSDNPRSESPEKIIDSILSGINRRADVHVEPDRANAIKLAVQGAGENDIVVVAGKGHETYQILVDRTIDFDDRIQVKSALEARLP